MPVPSFLAQMLAGLQPGPNPNPTPEAPALDPAAVNAIANSPAPAPTMANPQSVPNPLPQPAQQAAPHKGMLKQALTRFVYGGSQAMVKMAGLPTDEELATAQAQRDHLDAQTQMVKEQTAQMGKMVMVPTPNGYMAVPAGAKGAFSSAISGQYGADREEKRGQTSKWIAELNAEANAAKLGGQFIEGEDGKPKFVPSAPKDMAPTVVAGIDSKQPKTEEQLAKDYYDAIQAKDSAKAEETLKQLNALKLATKPPSSTTSKVDPIIHAYLGDAPDPQTDPEGAKKWAASAERIKTRMAADPKVIGYNALNRGRAALKPFETFDENGNVVTTSDLNAVATGAPAASTWNTIFGPTGNIKTRGQMSSALLQHIPEFEKSVQNLAAKGQLGAVQGRLNEYMNSGYFGDDKDVSEFVTTVGLLKSGAIQAHFGSKGGAQMLDHFDRLINTSQEPNAIIGSVEGLGKFLKTYKMEGIANPPRTSIPGKINELRGMGSGGDMITVQVPGKKPGQIHASQKAAFLAQYPNAVVK